jgi:hypothetical protein
VSGAFGEVVASLPEPLGRLLTRPPLYPLRIGLLGPFGPAIDERRAQQQRYQAECEDHDDGIWLGKETDFGRDQGVKLFSYISRFFLYR